MRRCQSTCAALLAAVITTGVPVAVFAQELGADEQEAKGLFELGSEAYAQARYERALVHFQEAYRLSQRPALLYNIGLTLANLRRDREALQAFEEYLQKVPEAPNRDVVENRIAILRRDIKAKEKEPAPVVAPTPAETARAQPVAPEPAIEPTMYGAEGPEDRESGGIASKWWFWAGIGGAVAAGVVVGILVASGGGQTVEGPVLLDDMTRVREL